MNPGRSLTAAMIVFALVVVPSAAYVGGYYRLAETFPGSHIRFSGARVIHRVYSQRWQADLFRPAARADGWLIGKEVSIHCIDDLQE